MRHFRVFFKKEIKEYTKTYKILILFTTFCFFGFLGPITAKYTPVLMNAVLPDSVQMVLEDPTWVDSWLQFFKNLSLLGLIIIIALCIGIMNREYQNGTLINLVSKGVSRTAIVLSKYCAVVVLFTVAYLLCVGITIGYTYLYFDVGINTDIAVAILALYLFYCSFLACVVFVSTISKKETSGILLVCVLLVPLFILLLFPQAVSYNPLTLLLNSMDIVTQTLVFNDILPAILITIVLIPIFLLGSVRIFKQKEL